MMMPPPRLRDAAREEKCRKTITEGLTPSLARPRLGFKVDSHTRDRLGEPARPVSKNGSS
jgi:hypothetical protein